MVGCVITRDGSVLGEGFHQRAGEAHAEVLALAQCADVKGATVYLTLEPCSHHGRTPPCVDALIAAGVARVVVATADPNPLVNGRGLAALQSAGIEVSSGLLESEASLLNEKFFHVMSRELPFVTLKAGMTLDGKLATATGQSQWITSPASRQQSLTLREEYDAIAVGSGTIRADDPQLTRRLKMNTSGRELLRVIFDGANGIPANAGVLTDEHPTLVLTSNPEHFLGSSKRVVEIKSSKGRLNLEAALAYLLREEKIQSVLVEGGSLLHSAFIESGFWQKMVLFVAPMVLGGNDAPSIFSGTTIRSLTEGHRFRFDSVSALGPDLMITAYREK